MCFWKGIFESFESMNEGTILGKDKTFVVFFIIDYTFL